MFYTNVYQKKNRIYYRGYQDGASFTRWSDYKPYLFVRSNEPDPDGYKTIFDEPVKKIDFKSLGEAWSFIKQYQDVPNYPIYGLTKFIYPFLNDTFPGRIQYDPSLIQVVSLDIEVYSPDKKFPNVETADCEVNAITLVKNGQTVTFGLKPFVSPPNNRYFQSDSEEEMLAEFINFWMEDYPDVVTGWSIEFFDIPYLVRRIKRVLGDAAVKKLAPFGVVEERPVLRPKGIYKKFEDRIDMAFDIAGVAILDYLQLYKKFTFTNHESYSLDNIAKAELKEAKKDHSQYDSLTEFYDKDPQKFLEYNIHDAVLVERLEDKLHFIQDVIAIAMLAKINFPEALTTMRPWDVIIHNFLLEQKKVISPKDETIADRELLGGYVKDTPPGLHRWVGSFDFDRLYPTVIVMCNISPETFVKKIHTSSPEHIIRNQHWPKNEDPDKYAICGNGCMFSKEKQGFLPAVISQVVDERAAVQKRRKALLKEDAKKHDKEIKQLDSFQKALKILANGLYGAVSMQKFRWYSLDMAESVTFTAQTCTRWIEFQVNKYLNKIFKTKDEDYIIAADTDSIYINLENLVIQNGLEGRPIPKIVEILDRVCKEKIEPVIERHCNELYEFYSVYKKPLHMKREVIANKAVWRGPKMYIMNVWDDEGRALSEPELKYKGIEAVRSSTPIVCRDAIKKCLKIIMNGTEKELQTFLKEFHTKFLSLPYDEVASPRSVNDLVKYSDPKTICKKSTPAAVRGALFYNLALKELGLTDKYLPIRDKDKVRWMYLREGNPLRTHVISAPDTLPKEFGLDDYIDYELQWDKILLSPIKSITDIVGWQPVKKASFAHLI